MVVKTNAKWDFLEVRVNKVGRAILMHSLEKHSFVRFNFHTVQCKIFMVNTSNTRERMSQALSLFIH